MVAGAVSLDAADLVTVLYFLAHDHDLLVREGARRQLGELSREALGEALCSPVLLPRVLDALARLNIDKPDLLALVASHPNCTDETRALIGQRGIDASVPTVGAGNPLQGTDAAAVRELPLESDDDAPVDEESEGFKSKYQLAQVMGVAEKIKIAQTGDKEWRMILIKDSNKLVSGTAIRNPRMTESEVLVIAKSAVQNDEILRVICSNKEWLKNYQIRKALVENTKTPLPSALRFLATLTDKDLAHLAKSKSVSSVLSTQAKKLLMTKKKG